MEEVTIFKEFLKYGIMGLLLVVTAYFLFKIVSRILKSYLEYNDTLFKNSLEHTKATKELTDSVRATSSVLRDELKEIAKSIDLVSTKDMVKKNHNEVMQFLKDLKERINTLAGTKNED